MRKLILAAVLAAPLFAHADVVNLLTNGGFEATTQGNGSWNIYSNLPGWTGGVAGIEVRNNVAGTAFEGKNFVELDTTSNSSMAQTVATQATKDYTLSFAFSARPGVAASSNGIEVLWNGSSLGQFTNAGGSVNNWSTYTFNVHGASNASTLLFRAIGTSDSYGGSLDNIRLITNIASGSGTGSTPAVPEPETYGMMLAGLGALALVARRKQAQKLG